MYHLGTNMHPLEMGEVPTIFTQAWIHISVDVNVSLHSFYINSLS